MSARLHEEFTSPVQLESLLEVPVKLILIEDLIRQKSASLSLPEPLDSYNETTGENSDSTAQEKGTPENGSRKRCLFECCATPSRWRDTGCYSNKSLFKTVNIPLPGKSLAVIPVMQIEESAHFTNARTMVNPTHVKQVMEMSTRNEDTDTEVELHNKDSDDDDDDERKKEKRLSPSPVTLPLLVSPNSHPPTTTTTTNIADNDHSTDEEGATESMSKNPTNDPIIQQETISPRNATPEKDSESASLPLSAAVPSFPLSSAPTVLLGKVTEKPTRFQDLITAHCTNTIRNNMCSTEEQPCQQQNVTRDGDKDKDTCEGESVDDTLKLTFYNEGRKESTKEFRTRGIELGMTLASGNDLRFYENRHGLQMSRVIREVGDAGIIDGNSTRAQQLVLLSDSESNGSKGKSNDNTQHYYQNKSNSLGNKGDNSLSPTIETITQSQQLRLTRSIIQNLSNNSNTNSPTNSNGGGNTSCGNESDKNAGGGSPHERPWEGLRISRCQKETVGEVVTLEGESSPQAKIISAATNPPRENEKGESENSIDRHLQTYLTSLRYVKPAESGNGRAAAGHQEGESNKGRSPIISPQSRQASSSVIPPVISPQARSPGSSSSVASGSAGAISGGVVRNPGIQRVSPSLQASSLESWPERNIVKVPTRPYLRRNVTYEQPQSLQHHSIALHHHHQSRESTPTPQQQQQQHPRMVGMYSSVMANQHQQASSSAFPLHSPPKRFKSATVPAPQLLAHSAMIHPSHSHQNHQQHQSPQANPQTALNRYSSVNNNVAQYPHQHPNRNGGIDLNDPTPRQRLPVASTSSANPDRNPGISYNNIQQQQQQQQQHYTNNPRPSTSFHPHTATASTTVSNIISPPHLSPASAQHNMRAQQLRYHTNSVNPHSHHSQQQQLEYQRQLQQSLLIASSSLASSTLATSSLASASSDPIDSSYEERLRRYTEIYQRQQLNKDKLKEYYDKYHFYPWDILTARDESIIRQIRSQQQITHLHATQQAQHTQQQQQQQEVIRESITNNPVRYDTARRIEMENAAIQQQQQQRHFPVSTLNLENSQSRNVSTFSPSHTTARSVSPPVLSIQPSTSTHNIQTVYNNHIPQHLQQRGEYALHQQQQQQQVNANNSRYFHQSEHQEHNNNHHRHYQQNQPRAIQQSIGILPTSDDIQNSPHYRSAYNQLATAAAAVSTLAAGAAAANMRAPGEVRTTSNSSAMVPIRDERIAHLLHSRSGIGARPVVMTVADPVPAPAEAVPLSIHRQALEQAIKNNQAAAANNTHGASNRDDSGYFRRDQRRSPISPQQAHQHQQVNRQMMSHSQLPHYENQAQRNVTIDGRVVTGLGAQGRSSEPLRRVPSPTLAHQTSVIRRIQQQESPPASSTSPFVTAGPSTRRFVESVDRPGISYRRISDSTDSNGGGGGGGHSAQAAAYLYQHLHNDNSSAQASSHYPQIAHHHHLSNNSIPRHLSSIMPIPRTVVATTENGQGIPRGTYKRRIIISNNNGINQNHPERCPEVASSPIPLIAKDEEVVTVNVTPTAVLPPTNDEELPDADGDEDMTDKDDSPSGGHWQYDHVVLLDKRIRTYMCKRCFETLKTEQQIRNHLFCKMLANHVQCHVCLQLINSDEYPQHLQIHGVRPPDNIRNIRIDN